MSYRLMRRWTLLALLALCFAVPRAAVAGDARGTAASVRTGQGYPQRALSNGVVRLNLYLPDARKGFYRGARFDWSGMIARAEYRGHTFFGPFRTPHQPEGTDFVVGPAEEFGMAAPLGYAEARVGETFLKIGVGLLEKIEEPQYRFFHPYTIRRPGTWKIRSGRSWIEFQQEMAAAGWGYRYTKRVALVGKTPAFTIHHRLRNTGTRRIETDQYGHNFIAIDDDPIGVNYRLRFPFRAPEQQSLSGIAAVEGNEIRFTGTLGPDQSLFTRLAGLRGTAADYETLVENLKTGAAIRITSDVAPAEFRFYAARTAACPEPFLALNLAPGEEKTWTVRYDLLLGEAR
jgi:hypothetical protein